MATPPDRIVSVIRLPDGGFGTLNEQNQSDLTLDDLKSVIDSFKLWAGIQWELKGGAV